MRASILVVLVGCANDPLYMPGPNTLEAGMDDGMGGTTTATSSMSLPIKPETAADMTSRMNLATKLAPVTVPYVRVGDMAVEVEWTIQNLDTMPGQAQIELNGANEYFVYDPSMIVLDPNDDEAPPTPGLQGDIPIDVAPGQEIRGLFTEDELLEASIDLDQITRGNVNPFRAMLTVSKNAKSFQPMTPPMPLVMDYVQTPTGPEVPREAFAQMVRIDLVFKPNRHMVMSYDVRVRDTRGLLADKLLTADPATLAQFAPAAYAP